MRKLKALALGLVAAISLTGCVQFTADLQINRSDRVSGDITAAVSKDFLNQLRIAGLGDLIPDVDQNLFAAGSQVTETEVNNSEWEGTRFGFDNRDLSILNLSDGADSYLKVYREGDYLITEGLILDQDLEQQDLPSNIPDPEVWIRIDYPGVVESTNGQQIGSVVEWRVEPGEDLLIQAKVLSQFIESNEPPGPPIVINEDYLEEAFEDIGGPLLRFLGPLIAFLSVWGVLALAVIAFSVVRHARRPGQYRAPGDFNSLNKDLFDKDKDE